MDLINIIPGSCYTFADVALSLFKRTITTYSSRTSAPAPRDYDVDPSTGFVLSRPLPTLPDVFRRWEDALDVAPSVLRLREDESEDSLALREEGEGWRANIRSWPVIDTMPLQNDRRLLQKAHMVLAFLVNFYAHSIPQTEPPTQIRIPESLSIPLVTVSKELGMAPILTFADTVMWNWELINPSLPVTADNMHFLHLLSGTEAEHNFYAASVQAELRGAEALRIIDNYMSLAADQARGSELDMAAICRLMKDLDRLAGVIDDLRGIMESMRASVDPHIFYFVVRPWWKGSGADGPESPGWIYEGVPNGDAMDLSGPSAGQSTIMHAIDIFLDIDHELGRSKRRYPAPSENNKKADLGFMQRMRRYMPGKHREYLEELLACPRSLREAARRTPQLKEPYDGAVRCLKKLRDRHIRIACLYVVTMSRSAPPPSCPVGAMMMKMRAQQQGPARGTGGNEVSTLLKAGRDATARALLSAN